MIEILRENIDEIRELRMSGVKIKDLAKKIQCYISINGTFFDN